jgi:hypothetical protein
MKEWRYRSSTLDLSTRWKRVVSQRRPSIPGSVGPSPRAGLSEELYRKMSCLWRKPSPAAAVATESRKPVPPAPSHCYYCYYCYCYYNCYNVYYTYSYCYLHMFDSSLLSLFYNCILSCCVSTEINNVLELITEGCGLDSDDVI